MDVSVPGLEEIRNLPGCADPTDPSDPGNPQVTILTEDTEGAGDLQEFLRQHGLSTRIMGADHPRVLDVGYGEDELVIIDALTAGMSDWGLLRHFSLRGDRPAIIVMADSADTIDRIVGLELGADDYVGKDLHNRELLARIRAVLRRRHPFPCPLGADDVPPVASSAASLPARDAGPPGERARFGHWEANIRDRELRYNETELVRLTRTEFTLLGLFLRHAGQPITRRALLDLIYGDSPERERTIDVLISRLRRKLGRGDEEIIRTIRGRGYLFLPEIRWM